MTDQAERIFDNPPLTQRTRASLDFLASVAKASNLAKADIFAVLDQEQIDAEFSKSQSIAERARVTETALSDVEAFVRYTALQNWRGETHGEIARQGFDEISSTLVPAIEQFDEGPATLHRDENFKAPAYWENVEFHSTSGGWDGHPYMGYVHGEIIHKIMVQKIFPGDIFKQRLQVAEQAPEKKYDKILELGCSTGHYTQCLQQAYPDAKITGVDLSIKTLEHALRVANKNGYDWDLYHADAADTSFENESFGLVTSYILLHELPAKAVKKVFDEAYRVLKPGGDLLFSDVSRYDNLSLRDSWWADFFARIAGEPHWRASASLNLTDLARDAGFADIEERALGPNDYPHLISARKPA